MARRRPKLGNHAPEVTSETRRRVTSASVLRRAGISFHWLAAAGELGACAAPARRCITPGEEGLPGVLQLTKQAAAAPGGYDTSQRPRQPRAACTTAADSGKRALRRPDGERREHQPRTGPPPHPCAPTQALSRVHRSPSWLCARRRVAARSAWPRDGQDCRSAPSRRSDRPPRRAQLQPEVHTGYGRRSAA